MSNNNESTREERQAAAERRAQATHEGRDVKPAPAPDSGQVRR